MKWTTKNITQHPLTQIAEVKEVFAHYVAMRKQFKKPATDFAQLLLWLELVKLSGENQETAISIIQKAIKSNWLDFYPIDNGYGKQQQQPKKQMKLL